MYQFVIRASRSLHDESKISWMHNVHWDIIQLA